MKQFAFVAALLLLLSMSFAENYTSQSTYDGWLRITRNIEVATKDRCTYITGTCSATGAKLPDGFGGFSGVSTSVVLTAQNIGPVDRNGVEIAESLLHVPTGASLTFNPLPSSNDGRQAAWAIGSLKHGESKSVYYAYSARSDEGDIQNIPSMQVKAAPAGVVLSAPNSIEVGSKVQLSLVSDVGTPVPDTVVQIKYPDGSSQYVKTNSEGKASFTAAKEGFYTYSVGGFNLLKLSSTEAQPKQGVPSLAASTAAGGEIASSIFGLLPILGAIFVIAVIMLIIYNFLTSKKEEGEEYSPEQPSTSPQMAAASIDSGGATYNQKFTFGGSPKREEKQTADVTRDLVGSRKKSMADAATQYSERVAYGERADAETTVEAGAEMTTLESQARAGGESAAHEEEIEKAIFELEAIRQKLRERKQQMESLGDNISTPSEETVNSDEPEAAEEPSPRKAVARKSPVEKKAPPQRVLPPKGKKLKFTTHGVKRR